MDVDQHLDANAFDLELLNVLDSSQGLGAACLEPWVPEELRDVLEPVEIPEAISQPSVKAEWRPVVTAALASHLPQGPFQPFAVRTKGRHELRPAGSSRSTPQNANDPRGSSAQPVPLPRVETRGESSPPSSPISEPLYELADRALHAAIVSHTDLATGAGNHGVNTSARVADKMEDPASVAQRVVSELQRDNTPKRQQQQEMQPPQLQLTTIGFLLEGHIAAPTQRTETEGGPTAFSSAADLHSLLTPAQPAEALPVQPNDALPVFSSATELHSLLSQVCVCVNAHLCGTDLRCSQRRWTRATGWKRLC